jgi:hypothetical protein
MLSLRDARNSTIESRSCFCNAYDSSAHLGIHSQKQEFSDGYMYMSTFACISVFGILFV